MKLSKYTRKSTFHLKTVEGCRLSKTPKTTQFLMFTTNYDNKFRTGFIRSLFPSLSFSLDPLVYGIISANLEFRSSLSTGKEAEDFRRNNQMFRIALLPHPQKRLLGEISLALFDSKQTNKQASKQANTQANKQTNKQVSLSRNNDLHRILRKLDCSIGIVTA